VKWTRRRPMRSIMRDVPTVREAVVCLLRELGMTTIFGNPGSTELPFFREFPDDFRYVLGLQESVVIGMADGYAQATRNAALVNLHSAAGVGHAMGNIFTAYRNRTPLVITAGQQARSILPYEPFLFATQATKLPEPYVKWSVEPARGEDVPGAIARAYHIAMQAPCGPTFVSIPVDDWDRTSEAIGKRTVSRTSYPDPDLVQMIDDGDVAAWTPVGTSIVCSVRHGVSALLERSNPPSRPAPTGRSAPPAVVTPNDRISMAYLMKTLSDLRPADSVIVEESPSSRRTMQTYLPIDRPNSFFTCASGGLGHSLPAAVGVALAVSSRRKVIGLFGDGSSMYSIQALWSAADLKLPLTVVIVNNGGYAALAEFSSHFNIKQLVGTKLPGIDFVGLARSMGCEAVRVERPHDLSSMLTAALQSPVPYLVDVAVV
jgi:thiamine pyrophosphate-dependent acetolactate synthase large subunit-like protein